MSDLFGAAPPPPAPARRRAAAAPAPREPAAAAPPAAAEPAPDATPERPAPAPPPTTPPRQYGPALLHDGRQVDSGGEEWRRECLARYLLALPPLERNDWLAPLGQEVQADLRRIMRGLRATERGTR